MSAPETPASPLLPLRVLILDDEANIRTTLAVCLQTAGHHVTDFGSGDPAVRAAGSQVFDLLFLDLRLGAENGLDYIPRFLAQSPWLKIVVITAYASIETAVEAVRRGATDYLPKPFTPEQVELLAARIAEVRALEIRVGALQDAIGAAGPDITFHSENHVMRSAQDLARRFAASNTAVLLQGEDGTGKRSLAHAIHEWSPRQAGPFMVASCRGQSEADLAAELFGAALPGRDAPGISRLERCAGGTLYLDDLCAMPPRLQFNLLQFLQTGGFEREGTFESIPANVRLIAGTSTPAATAVEQGRLRQDLFFALGGKLIELPALRHRPEDIAPLASSFLAFFSRRTAKPMTGFSADSLAYLKAYPWPGNIRELRNIMERATLLATPPNVSVVDFPPNMQPFAAATVNIGDLVSIDRIEELHIRSVLAKTHSLELASNILGIDSATLWRRRKDYGI